jgi:RND superfamily putative drug exporter
MKLSLSTEALARGASRRPWTVIGIWLVIAVTAVMLMGGLLGDALTTEDRITNNPESKQADDLLAARLGGSDTLDEMVIVRSATLTVDDPAYRSHVEQVFNDLIALGDEVVVGGVHYYMTGDESLVSPDRHTTLIPLAMPAGTEEMVHEVHAVADQANESGTFEVLVTGEATMSEDYTKMGEETLQTGETIGISVALIILALVFGAVAAALLPVVLGVVAVMVAVGVAALIGQIMDLSFFITNMITMMGLAVGIDYSLFIVSRYREERARGLDKYDAIAGAGSTASRAVLFSGMTVVLALMGLVVFPLTIFQSAGIGAIVVVLVAVTASLTLLPAILGLLGDKVNSFRIPLIYRRSTGQVTEGNGGFWGWTSRTVMRRPIVTLIIAGGLLVAALVPYFGSDMGMSGVSSLPDGVRSKDGFIALQEEFGYGQDAPAVVVIEGKTGSEAVQAGIVSLEAAVIVIPSSSPPGLKYIRRRTSLLSAQE